MMVRPRTCAHSLRTLLAVACVCCLEAGPALPQDEPQPDRERIVQLVAQFVGVPPGQVHLSSATYWANPLLPSPVFVCGCTVTDSEGRLLGKLVTEVHAQDHYLTSARWGMPNREALREAAHEFVATHFPGWSEDMVLQWEITSPQSFEQPVALAPAASTMFRWAEKREGAWTGTYVAVTFIDELPGLPDMCMGYVAEPRSLADVKVPEERAIELALGEARRRGLEEPVVRQADLYLDHHIRHFPHWMIDVAEPQPRGGATHPRQTSVMVDAVSGEVLDPAATMPGAQ
ncbi:MAG: hypothetical protein AB7Y46_03310 [Armatimonadota bacterium]